jgi:hypothetical protein
MSPTARATSASNGSTLGQFQTQVPWTLIAQSWRAHRTLAPEQFNLAVDKRADPLHLLMRGRLSPLFSSDCMRFCSYISSHVVSALVPAVPSLGRGDGYVCSGCSFRHSWSIVPDESSGTRYGVLNEKERPNIVRVRQEVGGKENRRQGAGKRPRSESAQALRDTVRRLGSARSASWYATEVARSPYYGVVGDPFCAAGLEPLKSFRPKLLTGDG